MSSFSSLICIISKTAYIQAGQTFKRTNLGERITYYLLLQFLLVFLLGNYIYLFTTAVYVHRFFFVFMCEVF